MTKRQFLAIMYLLTGVIPLIAQTFTEQKELSRQYRRQ